MVNRCQMCGNLFEESKLQLSHDVPTYVFEGNNRQERRKLADKYGRHYLCVKCHDIYERTVFAIMINVCSIEIKQKMIESAKRFAGHINWKTAIKEEKDDTN